MPELKKGIVPEAPNSARNVSRISLSTLVSIVSASWILLTVILLLEAKRRQARVVYLYHLFI